MVYKPMDLRGQRFGRLVAVELLGKSGEKRRWLCRCDCGGEKITRSENLLGGSSQSCGCLRLQCHTTHGGSNWPEYRVWHSAKFRCQSPSDPRWSRYGGRGIHMCPRWAEDFGAFIQDMGRRPSPKHTLGRIDNDGPYSPENCRWETYAQQARNRSISRNYAMDGRSQCLRDWAAESGLTLSKLRYHIEKRGRSLEETVALLTGPNPPRPGPKPRVRA